MWASSPLRRYIPGPGIDERIAQASNGQTSNPPKSYYHTNHQGSVIAMTNAAGTVSEKLAYDAYGNLTAEPPAAPTGQVYRYTGRRFDEETGLYYYRARYYSPLWGRFLQVDPIGYGDDLNLYAYVGNDPLNRVDPFGRDACLFNDKWCIEDPRTETPGQAPPGGHPVTEEQRKIDEVVVTARKEKRIGDQRIDFDLPYPQEQYGSVSRESR